MKESSIGIPVKLALIGMLAIAFAGCGEDREEEAGRTGTGTATEEAAKPTGPPVETIRVSETEYKLDPANPRVSKAGVVEFVVTNDGKVDHALEVEGPKGEVETEVFGPGERARLKADLSEPGSYTWYCPVGNHRELGMEGKIRVAGGGSGGGAAPQEEEKDEDAGGGGGY